VVGVMQRLQRRRGAGGDGDCAVSRLGCIALWRPARLDSTQQDAIGAAGGVHAVLSAMQRHVDSEAVQESGCGALSLLVQHSVVNATSMLSAGGVSTVLSTMRRHCHSVAVQDCGTRVLRGLGRCSDVSVPCASAIASADAGSAVDDVLTTMRQRSHSSAV
jgi:hypothetical protein